MPVAKYARDNRKTGLFTEADREYKESYSNGLNYVYAATFARRL